MRKDYLYIPLVGDIEGSAVAAVRELCLREIGGNSGFIRKGGRSVYTSSVTWETPLPEKIFPIKDGTKLVAIQRTGDNGWVLTAYLDEKKGFVAKKNGVITDTPEGKPAVVKWSLSDEDGVFVKEITHFKAGLEHSPTPDYPSHIEFQSHDYRNMAGYRKMHMGHLCSTNGSPAAESFSDDGRTESRTWVSSAGEIISRQQSISEPISYRLIEPGLVKCEKLKSTKTEQVWKIGEQTLYREMYSSSGWIREQRWESYHNWSLNRDPCKGPALIKYHENSCYPLEKYFFIKGKKVNGPGSTPHMIKYSEGGATARAGYECSSPSTPARAEWNHPQSELYKNLDLVSSEKYGYEKVQYRFPPGLRHPNDGTWCMRTIKSHSPLETMSIYYMENGAEKITTTNFYGKGPVAEAFKKEKSTQLTKVGRSIREYAPPSASVLNGNNLKEVSSRSDWERGDKDYGKVPSPDSLEKLLFKMPTTEIAKIFDVSDKAVEKWALKLCLKKPPRGYWRKQEVASLPKKHR